MSMDTNNPSWQREIISFKGIKSTFIIEGNVNDLYPYCSANQEVSGNTNFMPLNRILADIFCGNQADTNYGILFCDPTFNFTDPLKTSKTHILVKKYEAMADKEGEYALKMNSSIKKDEYRDSEIVRCSEIIRAAMSDVDKSIDMNDNHPIAIVVNFASRYVMSPSDLSVSENAFFLNLLHASSNAMYINQTINTLILVVDKLGSMPVWFYQGNPHTRIVTIPTPDKYTRALFINKRFVNKGTVPAETFNDMLKKLAELTDGMKLIDLDALRRLYSKSESACADITGLVSLYKYGFSENRWAQMRDSIEGDIKSRIERRVKGQPQAIERLTRVLKRSVTGLSGMQHSSDTKPRGILFLAGPTGTGKTEMVKTVSDIMFGDEKAVIRFDMSEYTAEHSDQKLFGAPPGYVGYANGGQLTNAVRASPFCILLFDEIEKAHPNIMDKFLQILEDGRLTDGMGNTVYFSETLIFFTSNVGISRETVDPVTHQVTGREDIIQPGERYSVIEDKIKDAMRKRFKPEVLNRIGENIVVFDYIDNDSTAEIARTKISAISGNILKRDGIIIRPTDAVLNFITIRAYEDEHRRNGGRGVSNVVESYYLNPLSEFLFDNKCAKGDNVIADIRSDMLVFTKA